MPEFSAPTLADQIFLDFLHQLLQLIDIFFLIVLPGQAAPHSRHCEELQGPPAGHEDPEIILATY